MTTISTTRRLGLALVVTLVATVLVTGAAPPAPVPAADAATERSFGSKPLDDVLWQAQAQVSSRPSCGLSRDRLAAMMLVPTFSETGALTDPSKSPGPMTLSRWDTQSALWAFGHTRTAYQQAFWHPGVGMWQFDSAGFWPLTAATAIRSDTSAAQAAQVLASRYCAASTSDVESKMRYAWAPWYYCAASGDNPCLQRFRELFDGSKLVNVRRDATTSRYGGMTTARRCRVPGIGETDCFRVDPAKAEGHRGWTSPTGAPTPVTAPFYVFEHGDREHRWWLKQDTGYDRTVLASKPVRANARTSLTWATMGDLDGLCDLTARIGFCGPIGVVDSASSLPGGIHVSGWVADPDSSEPTDVHVYVDGRGAGVLRADQPRPDLAGSLPGLGQDHGFSGLIPAGEGVHSVCVYGIDRYAPIVGNALLGCRTVEVVAGRVAGGIDHVTGRPGEISLRGWALDPHTTGPTPVHVYVGSKAFALSADQTRGDLASIVPGLGLDHGFDRTIPAPAGTHRVCIYGIDSVAPHLGNVLLGCRTVSVTAARPAGAFESVDPTVGGIRARGWVIDRDTTAPTAVHLYVAGRGYATTASVARPDVAANAPLHGAGHGFDVELRGLPSGEHQVCAYGIDSVAPHAGNVLLGCKGVTVRSGMPIGAVDQARLVGPRSIEVSGWTVDPDTTEPTDVHVYVAGRLAVARADQERPELADVMPGYGTNHGFTFRLDDLPAGRHTLCAYGIDSAPPIEANALLGCQVVEVPAGVPFGHLDSVTGGVGVVDASGWTIDPDTADPIDVHVYVGTRGVAVRADVTRTDVGDAYPAYGSEHGYSVALPAAPGTHRVCAYAINVGPGSNALLGCRTVTVR